MYHTQLDALSPAVDVLVRDLPESSTREKAVLTLKTAVEVWYIYTSLVPGSTHLFITFSILKGWVEPGNEEL